MLRELASTLALLPGSQSTSVVAGPERGMLRWSPGAGIALWLARSSDVPGLTLTGRLGLEDGPVAVACCR